MHEAEKWMVHVAARTMREDHARRDTGGKRRRVRCNRRYRHAGFHFDFVAIYAHTSILAECSCAVVSGGNQVSATRLPTLFISHGGGPWPYIDAMKERYAITSRE